MATTRSSNGKGMEALMGSTTELGSSPTQITITPPNLLTLELKIVGVAPYMQAKFSEKAKSKIKLTQERGSVAKKGEKREPRDFAGDFIAAQHLSTEGWAGIPAAALRNACIDACRMVGFQMTRAKMSVFVEPDGFDAADGTPLVKLDAKAPERTDMAVRNATGVVDIRIRPMWREWAAKVRLTFDADQFTAQDVTNLLARAGLQVGIGEGRPFSKSSAGMGFGLFRVEGGGS